MAIGGSIKPMSNGNLSSRTYDRSIPSPVSRSAAMKISFDEFWEVGSAVVGCGVLGYCVYSFGIVAVLSYMFDWLWLLVRNALLLGIFGA
jgi:hypothetical protein